MTDELCCILTLMTSRGVTKSDVRIAPEHADSAVSAGVMITLCGGAAASAEDDALGVMEVAWLVGKAKGQRSVLCRSFADVFAVEPTIASSSSIAWRAPLPSRAAAASR